MSKENTAEIIPHIDSNCENCRWYLGDRQCPAFELRIPDAIWLGEHNMVMDDQVIDLTYDENGPLL